MARNQATRDAINQTLQDLDDGHEINRIRRARTNTRYNSVSVNSRNNITPIAKTPVKKDSSPSQSAQRLRQRVKSAGASNVYYLRSAFNNEEEKPGQRTRPSAASSNRARTAQKRQAPKVSKAAVWNPKKRATLLAILMIVPLIGVSIKLVDIQYLNSSRYSSLGLAQRTYTRNVVPERGTITDRNGNILAISQPAWDIAVDPSLVKDDSALVSSLSKLTVFDDDKLENALKNKKSRFAYVAQKVDEPTAKRIQAKALPGIIVMKTSKREYPSGTTGANLIGFVGNDLNGLGGIEYLLNKKLSGVTGQEVIERDRQGREISTENRKVKTEVPGQDVALTIDQGLQFESERIMQEEVVASGSKGGTAIIADIKTGEILSMVSIVGGPSKPVTAPVSDVNHAVADVYEPGSTNKVITVGGALEEKIISPSTSFSVADNIVFDKQNFPDAEPHPTATWNAGDILRESSNVGTIMIASRLQKTRLDKYMRAFGYGSKTALNFPGEAPGILLNPKNWSDTSIATIPTGNGIAVTPMQMLSVYMTIANGGQKVDPRIVKSVLDENGDRIETKVTGQTQVISNQTAGQLNTMLQGVVKNGTGTKANVPGYSVAGKTGTSRKPPYTNDKHMASFAGFAPASNPRLAVIVILDEPEGQIYGGTVAAPVFSRLMSAALRVVGVTPDQPTQGLSITNSIGNTSAATPTTKPVTATTLPKKTNNNLTTGVTND